MLRKAKSSSAIAKPSAGTPQTSRKIYTFSKWLTQGDQIELAQKDMENGFRFKVKRHRLAGGVVEGSLVVGTTALTFLNHEEKIEFIHPFGMIGKYCKTAAGQLEYCLSAKFDNAKYVFDVHDADPADVVTEIDRASLRLEKNMASGGKSPRAAAPPKSPRGPSNNAPRMFDADLQQGGSSSAIKAPPPPQNVANLQGSRFRVTLKDNDSSEHAVVAIVNSESITLVDPSVDTQGEAKVHFKRCKWQGVASITSSRNEVKIVSRDGYTLVLLVNDAHEFIKEMNEMRDAHAKAAAANEKNGDDKEEEDVEVLKW